MKAWALKENSFKVQALKDGCIEIYPNLTFLMNENIEINSFPALLKKELPLLVQKTKRGLRKS